LAPLGVLHGKSHESRRSAMRESNDGGGAMKWLIWSPAVAILFLAAAFPGGLVLLALPLLALGYVLISLIALGGRAEKAAAAPVRVVPPTSRRSRDELR
jgi:hypothetical protein